MERPRNEITGDNLITAFPEYYPAGFKIFAPKTKYIRDSCESNEDLLFSVSYKHTVLIGYFFFSSHSETISFNAAGERQMLTDVSSSFDEVSDEESRSNSCFGSAKKARVWVIATAVSFFLLYLSSSI